MHITSSYHIMLVLLPFFISNALAILSGTPAPPFGYQFIVSIRGKTGTCAGVLISQTIVVIKYLMVGHRCPLYRPVQK
jgi:hypothetical protein